MRIDYEPASAPWVAGHRKSSLPPFVDVCEVEEHGDEPVSPVILTRVWGLGLGFRVRG